VVLGLRRQGDAEAGGGGGCEAEIVDVRELEAPGEEEDVTITETAYMTAAANEVGTDTRNGRPGYQ
jgi:predicted RNA-binding protein associated with RNAse of E/G family